MIMELRCLSAPLKRPRIVVQCKKECQQVIESFNENWVIRTDTKGQQQRFDFQRNALTSLLHLVQLYSKVD